MYIKDFRAFVNIWYLGGCLFRVREVERKRCLENVRIRDDEDSCCGNCLIVFWKFGYVYCNRVVGRFLRFL